MGDPPAGAGLSRGAPSSGKPGLGPSGLRTLSRADLDSVLERRLKGQRLPITPEQLPGEHHPQYAAAAPIKRPRKTKA